MKIVWAHMAVFVLAFSHKAYTQCTGPGSPAAAFTYTQPDSCAGTPVLFQNLSTEAVTYHWNFGDPASGTADTSTSTNPQHIFSATGTAPQTFTVTLTATGNNGCVAQITQTVSVAAPVSISTPGRTTVCQNAATFWLYSSPGNGTWAGPHITPSGWFSPTVPGTFTLVYTVGTGACQASDTAIVVVHPLPVLNAGNDTTVCGSAVPFVLEGVPPGGIWDGMGITDPHTGIFSPAEAGVGTWPATYMYTDTNTCYQYDYRLIEVLPQTTAAFTADSSACIGVPVTFTAQAAGNVSYTWHFGDSSQSPFSADSHTYTGAGDYTVQLIVSAGTGCSDTAVQTVHIITAPQAAIAASPVAGCGPLSVDLASASTDPGMSYVWDFGNGSNSTSALPGNAWYAASMAVDTVYTVTLTVSNTCGSDEALQNITVFAQPTAAPGADTNTGCSPLTVQFTQPGTGGTSYEWIFGDGDVSSQPAPAHTYQTPGTYTALLVVNNGCASDTAPVNITVFDAPQLSFTAPATVLCQNRSVSFVNTSSDISAPLWIFGDGSTSGDDSPVHTYTSAGTFLVSLSSPTQECADTVSVLITVNPMPLLDIVFPAGPFCAPYTAVFMNNSQQVDAYTWDFGNGNTATGAAPSHSYLSDGTYTVTVIGEHAAGCADTATGTVTLLPGPQAAFALPQTGCAPVTWTPDNQSTGAVNYAWDFGNGYTSSLHEPSVMYELAGNYTVTLQVTDAYGCTDTVQQSAVLHNKPRAATGAPLSACAGMPVQFENHSGYGTEYRWYFGNGQSSAAYEPVYLYELPGLYDITLIVSDTGCADTLTIADFVNIYPIPKASFLLSSDTVYIDHPVITLSSLQPDGTCTYRLPNGETANQCQVQTLLTDVEAGLHTITLAVTNDFGCRDSSWNSLYVTEGTALYVPDAFTPNADSENERFTAYGNGIKTFEMTVFDRWGNLLFRTNDMNQGWDGKNRSGQTVKQELYIWKIDARDVRDKPIRMNGQVTVIW